jgi:superfamily II DNA or RNA helicase
MTIMKNNNRVIEPLPHQYDLLKELQVLRSNSNNKALILLPSGAGKTHSVAYDLERLRPKSFIYIVHRSEILTQAIDIFKQIWKDLNEQNIGIINRDFKDYQKPYLFATIQTLSIKKNYEKLDPNIEYMIIDEFHHSAAPTYERVINYFNPRYFTGLTATPTRLDGKNIMSFVDNNVVADMDIFEGVRRNILCEFYYVGLFDNVDYTNIRWNGRDYNKRDLDKYLIIEKRDNAILNEYLTRIQPERRQTLIFCVSVKHVHRMTALFRKNGIKAAGITYKEPFIERKEIIDKFRKGVYEVLLTRDILNEGVDFPECSAVMLLRPTWSKVVFFQQIGRGLRKKEGKKNVLILDFIGNYHHAFMKREWLGSGEKRNGGLRGGGNRTKPIYEHNIGYHVEFDPRVLDIFDFQRMHSITYRNYQKQELIDNYHNVAEKKGRRPIIKDMDGEYSKIRKRTYLRMFGSWNKFLEEVIKTRTNRMGNSNITLEIMKKMYFDRKKELNTTKYLTRREFREKYRDVGKKFITTHYNDKWKNFLLAIGEDLSEKCEWCNKTFVPSIPKKLMRFCSKKCGDHSQIFRKTGIRKKFFGSIEKRNCKNCKKEFTIIYGKVGSAVKVFCTEKCAHRYWDRNKRKRDEP